MEPLTTPSGQPAPPWRIYLAAGRSVAALIGRTAITKAMGMAGGILLSRLLLPRDFGLFAVVNLFLGAVSIVGDLGMTGVLVQQREEPTTHQLRAIFSFQLVLAVAAALLMALLASLAARPYHLGQEGVWLVRFTGVYLVADAFRSIPTALLTRQVRFSRAVRADVVAAASYQVLTVAGAWAGLGAWALSLGLVGNAVAGAVVMQLLARWPMGLAWDWRVIRNSTAFGAFLQGAQTLAAVELSSAAVLVGWLAGPTALGYMAFALTVASTPMLIATMLSKVAFPSLARLQEDRERLGGALGLSVRVCIYAQGALTLPLLLMPGQVIVVVFSARWLPAAHLVLLMGVAWFIRGFAGLGLVAWNSLGWSALTFWFHAALTGASWSLALALVRIAGSTGVAEAWLLASLPLPVVLLVVRGSVHFSLRSSVLLPLCPLLVALGLGLLPWPYIQAMPPAVLLLVKVPALWLVYGAVFVAVERSTLRQVLDALRAGGMTRWLLARRDAAA